MKKVLHFLRKGLEKKHNAAELESSCRRACTSARDSNQNEKCLRESGPKRNVIYRSVACRRYDSRGMEKRVSQRGRYVSVYMVNVARYNQRNCRHNSEIDLKLLAFEKFLESSYENEIEKVEIDTEKFKNLI